MFHLRIHIFAISDYRGRRAVSRRHGETRILWKMGPTSGNRCRAVKVESRFHFNAQESGGLGRGTRRLEEFREAALRDVPAAYGRCQGLALCKKLIHAEPNLDLRQRTVQRQFVGFPTNTFPFAMSDREFHGWFRLIAGLIALL